MTARIALIAAVAENGVIGAEGAMPWRLSTDLKRFKRLTVGKPLIMGRSTFEGLGVPLAGRSTIVVSRQAGYAPRGVAVAASVEAAIAMARSIAARDCVDEIMIGGGGTIYAAAMPLADRLYVTHVGARPAGDTRFPAIEPALWRAVETETVPAGPKDTAATRFVIYDRVRPFRPPDSGFPPH